jgi:ATP-binding cassette subfamily B protein
VAEPIETFYGEAERLVRGAGPALFRLPGEGEPRFLALLSGRRRMVAILGPDRRVHRVRPEVISAALCHEIERPLVAGVDRLLGEAGLHRRRWAHVRAAILHERLRAVRIGGGWMLRLAPVASLWRQMGQAHLPHRLLALVGIHALQYLLWLLAWWLVGWGALQGRIDQGWLFAWALLLLTMAPLQWLLTWLQGVFAIGTGGLFKQRLLYGALRLDLEEMRRWGAGQLFGRVIESEAVEALALSGGFLAVLALVELIMAAAVLGMGAGGKLHTFLLLAWVAFALLVGWRYFKNRQRWTEARLRMTHDLVERMVGHRTRLAQELRECWHDGEDQSLEQYATLSREMDYAAVAQALVPRGWLVLGLLGLAPAFVDAASSPAALAVSLGGILLASRALARLVAGLAHLISATIAWEHVAPFFHAATRPEACGSPTLALAFSRRSGPSETGQAVIAAHDLTFRYRQQDEPVLRACHLQVWPGERILLEGPSGGGKSTLASLLTGLRQPASGLLLLRGLDRQTLGSEGWRRRVVGAPQFHENHVLTGTFAFNLLMGRRWPAQPGDLQEAEEICRELGLGDLLDRMPAGLLQQIGETGWQLSHGERSRLYVARALLQKADLVVLDESLAALDPETLRQNLRCILHRASTLLVIAHP